MAVWRAIRTRKEGVALDRIVVVEMASVPVEGYPIDKSGYRIVKNLVTRPTKQEVKLFMNMEGDPDYKDVEPFFHELAQCDIARAGLMGDLRKCQSVQKAAALGIRYNGNGQWTLPDQATVNPGIYGTAEVRMKDGKRVSVWYTEASQKCDGTLSWASSSRIEERA